MSFESALATVRHAHEHTAHGAAKGMLAHVLECAMQGARIEWYAGEAIFARLVIDERWCPAHAQTVYTAVRELATVPMREAAVDAAVAQRRGMEVSRA